jgi:hypothetical protein
VTWATTSLGELVDPAKGSLVSGPFGSNIGSRFFVEDGIPIIRGNNLSKGNKRFIDDGFVFLTEEKAAEFSNCIARPGDIVFTAAGSIGQVGSTWSYLDATPLGPEFSGSCKCPRAKRGCFPQAARWTSSSRVAIV